MYSYSYYIIFCFTRTSMSLIQCYAMLCLTPKNNIRYIIVVRYVSTYYVMLPYDDVVAHLITT